MNRKPISDTRYPISETINAKGLHYRDLNEEIRRAISNGTREVVLDNVNGQRYIGGGIKSQERVIVNGVPGNDLAAFMDGLTIIVNGNAQDGVGNTMNSGSIIIHGSAGDITGLAMRGGKIYIKGDVGYRAGIHMKSYLDSYPVIIIGGSTGNFLGEYMAGGLIVVLGLNKEKSTPIVGSYIGTGMHGGTMYIRGQLEEYQLGKEVKSFELTSDDRGQLEMYLKEYATFFGLELMELAKEKFTKLIPYTSRPYGRLYAY